MPDNVSAFYFQLHRLAGVAQVKNELFVWHDTLLTSSAVIEIEQLFLLSHDSFIRSD